MFGHTDMSQICWHFQTATMVVVTRRDESWGPFASDGKLFMYGDYSNLNFVLPAEVSVDLLTCWLY
jgi:hypothetical protein